MVDMKTNANTAPATFDLSISMTPGATREHLAATLEGLARMLRSPSMTSSGGGCGIANYTIGTNHTAGTFREGHNGGRILGEWSGAPKFDEVEAQRQLQVEWDSRETRRGV